jgi:nickel-dependent lactate racemase
LAYGREGLWIELPEDAPVTVIEPQFVPGLPDERAAITAALRSPVGTLPLRELVRPDDMVAVVFSDLTRPMPNDRVLPPLLDELALAGVPDERIVLVNALGTHRPQTGAELTHMLGSEVVSRYRIVQHDAWDDENLVEAGRNRAGRPVRINRTYVEASVRILTGFIEPHFFAGFSGGPKSVLPGIADIEAILDNHGATMLAHPKTTWAGDQGQPHLGGDAGRGPEHRADFFAQRHPEPRAGDHGRLRRRPGGRPPRWGGLRATDGHAAGARALRHRHHFQQWLPLGPQSVSGSQGHVGRSPDRATRR